MSVITLPSWSSDKHWFTVFEMEFTTGPSLPSGTDSLQIQMDQGSAWVFYRLFTAANPDTPTEQGVIPQTIITKIEI